jgi:hypothetical protein
MIYDFPSSSDIISQGDIFIDIPLVDFNFLKGLSVIEAGSKIKNITWQEIIANPQEKEIVAVLGITSVPAIVITQTCDAQRKEYVTLCEIIELQNIEPFKSLHGKSLKNQVASLIDGNRKKHDYFYLPPDTQIGFTERMAVLFANTIRLQREDLETLINNRKGRLKKYPYEHFREKLSDYFRRYAVNDWYMLTKDEIEHHHEYPNIEKFPWQCANP